MPLGKVSVKKILLKIGQRRIAEPFLKAVPSNGIFDVIGEGSLVPFWLDQVLVLLEIGHELGKHSFDL